MLLKRKQAELIVSRIGADILASDNMQLEKSFIQHGQVSVYAHSVAVAVMCVMLAALLKMRVDRRKLVRGALLHDYFLYDWHIPDRSHRLHGFRHPHTAAANAQRDFELCDVEKNMILSHMFPLGRVLPRHKESVLLCTADKLCATKETFSGLRAKLARLFTRRKSA